MSDSEENETKKRKITNFEENQNDSIEKFDINDFIMKTNYSITGF